MDITQIIEILMAIPFIIGRAVSLGVVGVHAIFTAFGQM